MGREGSERFINSVQLILGRLLIWQIVMANLAKYIRTESDQMKSLQCFQNI